MCVNECGARTARPVMIFGYRIPPVAEVFPPGRGVTVRCRRAHLFGKGRRLSQKRSSHPGGVVRAHLARVVSADRVLALAGRSSVGPAVSPVTRFVLRGAAGWPGSSAAARSAWSSSQGCTVDVLASRGDEGRWSLR